MWRPTFGHWEFVEFSRKVKKFIIVLLWLGKPWEKIHVDKGLSQRYTIPVARPSRELTYTTLGKGQFISHIPWMVIC